MSENNFSYPLFIREQHLDSYGHVNNATYVALFEEARWEMSTQRDYGYNKVHATGKGPVILEISLKFIKEVKLRETVTMKVVEVTQDKKITRLKQIMYKENGEIACELSLVAGFFDLKERKLIMPSPEWLAVLGIEA